MSIPPPNLAVLHGWADLPTATPLPAGDVVAWRHDGRLVRVDPRTGVQRELARVPVNVGVGPAGVALSPDRRTAYVSWSIREPGCFYQLGAIRTDGHGQLRSLDSGIGAAVSPDGTKLAYYRISDSSCHDQALVIVNLKSAVKKTITLVQGANGFDYGGGPWWRADNRRLIAPIGYPGIAPNPVGRELDTATATSIDDARPVDLACVPSLDDAHYVMGVTTDDRIALVDLASQSNPGVVSSCDTRTGRVRPLVDLKTSSPVVGWSLSRVGLVAVDIKGDLWRWDGQNTRATRIANGPFQSAAG